MKTIIYNESNAYDIISRDIESNFNLYINKSKDDINVIAIVGGYHCWEAEIYLQLYKNAKIYIFEPVSEFFDIIKQKYGSNPRCELHNIAISNIVGDIYFYRTSSPGSDSIYPVIENNNSGYSFKSVFKIKVKSDKLENIIKENIDLLSIDVQGAELEVLKGTNLDNVSSIFAEVQLSENKINQIYDGQCFMDDLKNYLDDKFSLHSIGLDNEIKNGTGNAFWIKK